MKYKESEYLELKKSTAELKEAIISIVAILNKHKKGVLYFGIKNNGEIIGQNISDATLREISQIITHNIEPKIYPEIKVEEINDIKCIKVSFEGHEQPYFAYGRSYIRVADEDKQLSAKELENLFIQKNKEKLAWDTDICKNAKLSDIDKTKLKNFLKIAGKKYDSVENSLEKLQLMCDGKITNAAMMLFGKNPRDFFLNARLRGAVFTTTDTPIDMQDFEGDIFSLIDQAEKYILKNIHIGMKLEGLLRVDVPEINKDAFREAIINAFCHRDYWSLDSVDVAIFKDRVEIRSPGLLIAGLTVETIKKQQISERRNELIAKIFKEAHFVESWGTGIRKMLKLEPNMKIAEVGTHFITMFFRKEGSQISGQISGQILTKRQEEILDLIKQNPKITREELSNKLQINSSAIQKHIEKLKSKNILKRIGPDKGGYWEINN